MLLKIKFITVIFLVLNCNAIAQSLPKITAKDYGFTQSVKKVEMVTYTLHSEKAIQTEKVSYNFNTDGTIKSYERKSNTSSDWLKLSSNYKKGLLRKRIIKHRNSNLNRKHQYVYDTQHNLIEERIYLKKGEKNHIKYEYQNNKLQSIIANINDTNSITTFYYTQKGNLYKKVHHQKHKAKEDVISNHFYLEDKEILSYTEPSTNYKAYIYTEIVDIAFKIIEENNATSRINKGIQRFNKEAPKDNIPFNLEQNSNQTWQFYEKHLDKVEPYQITIYSYKKDTLGNKVKYATANVNIKQENIATIQFFRTTLQNGNIVGDTKYNENTYLELVEHLKYIKIPK